VDGALHGELRVAATMAEAAALGATGKRGLLGLGASVGGKEACCELNQEVEGWEWGAPRRARLSSTHGDDGVLWAQGSSSSGSGRGGMERRNRSSLANAWRSAALRTRADRPVRPVETRPAVINRFNFF